MGLLDAKSRMLDAILTIEGRRQMARGIFDVAYVTFGDGDVAYVPDLETGHADPNDNRIYFEACNLPQDQINYDTNDVGHVIPFRSQDIIAKSPNNNIPQHVQGTLINGRLQLFDYHHGRTIKSYGILSSSKEYAALDEKNGIRYTDANGVIGNLLMNTTSSYTGISSIVLSGNGLTASIPVRGSPSPHIFANMLSEAIGLLSSSAGGPKVAASVIGNDSDLVCLDIASPFTGSVISITGSFWTGEKKPDGSYVAGSAPPIYVPAVEAATLGGSLLSTEVIGPEFASQITDILTSSFDNFKKLYSISTVDSILGDDSFTLDNNEITIDLSGYAANDPSIKASSKVPNSLNSLRSLFQDNRFSSYLRFRYLPPITKTSYRQVQDKTNTSNLTPYLLGDYPKLSPSSGPFGAVFDVDDGRLAMMYHDIVHPGIQAPIVKFTNTSIKNDVLLQVFEIDDNSSTAGKLDIAGPYTGYSLPASSLDPAGPTTGRIDKKCTAYHIGKTYIDNRGTTVFCRIFTIIFYSKYDNNSSVVTNV